MNLVEFHFIRPYWFLSLLPVIAIFILLLKNKLSQGSWSSVCDTELLPFILQETPAKKNRWPLFIGSFASLLVITALAGPTWERLPSPVFRNDAALVIALDLSRSMDASDIKPSRLSMARYKIADILNQRKDGQTALLVYAGDAFTVTPLTTDTETIASQLSALTTEIMPVQGSNTPLALSIATKLLKQAGLQSGEILLITDGVNFKRSLSKVKSLSSYRLSILGIGTSEGVPIKISDGGFLKDAKGDIVLPKLNSDELSQLANAGHGTYRTISTDNSDIEAILSQLESPIHNKNNDQNNLLIDQWNEKGPWLLLLVIPLVATQFKKGLLALAILCLLPFPKTSYALGWSELWETPNQQAQQDFLKKDYQKAANKFQNPQWKAAAQYKAGQYEQAITNLQSNKSASGLYNLGNALAKSGKLPEAIEAYNNALKQDPNNEDTIYNKELVEKELEKQQKNNNKKDSENKESKNNKDKEKKEGNESGEGEPTEKPNSEQPSESDPNQNSETKNSEQAPKEASEDKNQETTQEQQKESSDKQQETEEVASPKETESAEYNESEQANEQWLKRIPDDPAGLLKRKFKYQYGQRGKKNENNQAW